MVVYFDPNVCKYCLMQDERYPLNCCRNFSNRRDDIFAACEQLMPEGDVIYGDVKETQKRICPFVLAVVIFVTSVVSGPMSLTARAASVTVDAEFSTELAMLLYNIMETVAISSGIKDGLDDYESGSTLTMLLFHFWIVQLLHLIYVIHILLSPMVPV